MFVSDSKQKSKVVATCDVMLILVDDISSAEQRCCCCCCCGGGANISCTDNTHTESRCQQQCWLVLARNSHECEEFPEQVRE